MVASPSLRVANQAAATADTRRKRERQVMASAMAFAMDASALRRTKAHLNFIRREEERRQGAHLSLAPSTG